MPRGHTGGRETSADKKDRQTVPSGFCGLILKYWLWQQLHHVTFYSYVRTFGAIKIEFIVLFD
jgi:hypothetical protein